MAKNMFTTNWYMYRVCLPSVLKSSETSVLKAKMKPSSKKVCSKNLKTMKAKEGKC